MSALPKRFFTPDEYLDLEVKAPYKSQYVGGEIFAMAGTQLIHNEILGNIVAGLHGRFLGRPSRVYFQDIRLQDKPGDLYTYPDAMALCGEPKLDTTRKPHGLLNPQVIFEVLSPSTEGFDRGDKFTRYRKLESLTDYVLVGSEQMSVEHFVRQADGAWSFRAYDQPDKRLVLASVDCEVPLAEIYDKVVFPGPDSGG